MPRFKVCVLKNSFIDPCLLTSFLSGCQQHYLFCQKRNGLLDCVPQVVNWLKFIEKFPINNFSSGSENILIQIREDFSRFVSISWNRGFELFDSLEEDVAARATAGMWRRLVHPLCVTRICLSTWKPCRWISASWISGLSQVSITMTSVSVSVTNDWSSASFFEDWACICMPNFDKRYLGACWSYLN